MTWIPSPAARAGAERAHRALRWTGGSALTSDDVRAVQRPIAPGLLELVRHLNARGVYVGMPRGAAVRAPLRGTDGRLRNRDVHEEGRAGDAMLRGAPGTQVADWLTEHAEPLGVQLVIWDRTYYGADARTPIAAYHGRNPHTDHVHFELTPEAGADRVRVRAGIENAREIGQVGLWSPRGTRSAVLSMSSSGAPVERTVFRSAPPRGWMQDRFALAVRELRDRGLPLDESLELARALVALWVSEVGWTGAAEKNFNPGNVTGSSSHGYYRIARSTPGPTQFRAYATAEEGVSDAVTLLSTGRYRRAFDALARRESDAVRWYDSILRAGYTAHTPRMVAEYREILSMIPRMVNR